MIRSAHLDSFARDHLPPAEQWPDFVLDLPELNYPDRLNGVVELLDRWIARGHGERPCLISEAETLTYRQLAERVGLGRCTDPAFLKLKRLLREWFGTAN